MEKEVREFARAVCCGISSYDPHTTFEVQQGKLIVTCPDGLLPEQVTLLRSYRDVVIAYLTNPPEQQGQCVRGHAIRWVLSPYGVWLCSCYFDPPITAPLVAAPSLGLATNSIKEYWTPGPPATIPARAAIPATIHQARAATGPSEGSSSPYSPTRATGHHPSEGSSPSSLPVPAWKNEGTSEALLLSLVPSQEICTF
jgi:hypothetical protein